MTFWFYERITADDGTVHWRVADSDDNRTGTFLTEDTAKLACQRHNYDLLATGILDAFVAAIRAGRCPGLKVEDPLL